MPLAIGTRLGPYEILALIGAGGMGEVYRAKDLRLDRMVAVKVLGERLPASEQARARLMEEARTASALNHPHICTIHEVGEAHGQTYVVMEYVQGQPLNKVIPGEGLPVEILLRYGAQISEAVAHAHERGVIHRDLKSSNIMVTKEGRTKVLDFGLAKRLRDIDVEEATRSQGSLTEAGSVVGTLHYLSPEALRGEPADARRDLWALGVVLYEMAAGRLPFQGQTGFELSAAILREPPAPLPPQVPSALRGIVQRCLAKEPGERYQRAGELRAALEAIQPGLLPAPAAPERKISRRHWLWPVAGGALLVLGVGLRLGSKWTGAPSGQRTSTGGRASANPQANESFERAMLFMTTQLDWLRGQQLLERALALDPRFAEARAWYGYGFFATISSGGSNDSNLLYRAEQEMRRALQDDPSCAQAYTGLAATYFTQGRTELVREQVEKALKADPGNLAATIWLSVHHWFTGDNARVRSLLEQVLRRDPLSAPARFLLGEVLREHGDTAGAIREQEAVLEQALENTYALQFLAHAHLDAGDVAQARQALERARPADRSNFRIRLGWALLLAREGNREQALRELDEEVLKYAGAVSWATIEAAECFALAGETSKALEWLDRAVRNGDERAEWFRRDPLLASIREHPRFQQALESIDYRRRQRVQGKP